jgi:hypothetical protein
MDPFTLFAMALAAGVLSRGSSDGLDEAEGVLRIRRIPSRYTASPWPFVYGTSLQSDDPREDDGIWHVTTNLPAVLEDGLWARRQTGAVGLGGGLINEAPDKVSATLRYSAALRLYRGIRLALEAARGQVRTADLVAEFLRQNDDALDQVSAWEDYLLEAGEMGEHGTLGHELSEILEEGGRSLLGQLDLTDPYFARTLDGRFYNGRTRYEILQKLERAVAERLHSLRANFSEDPQIDDPIGFTAPWHQFVKIDPQNIAILQLSADRKAKTDLVPSECEIRFWPEDLFVIGFSRPLWKLDSKVIDQVERAKKLAESVAAANNMPAPTEFLDEGMRGGVVFLTADPEVVVRVAPIKESALEEMFFEEDFQGGVVKLLGMFDVPPFRLSWKEKVDTGVESFLLRTYRKNGEKLCGALLGLDRISKDKLATLSSFPATKGFADAIRSGLPTSDLDLRLNLGVTKDGRVVAFDL